MNRDELSSFLDNKKGYRKWGSNKLISHLQSKGISLTNMTQQDVKELLRLKNQKPKKIKLPKIMVYDLETSRVEAHLWNTGKQYVGHDNLKSETQILSVAWKWLGEDTVHDLKWSMKKRNDKKLVKAFVEEYNKADMVIGFNNNSFDNKLLNSRAMKYNLDINTTIKSFDIMKQAKKVFRLASYSMAYISRFLEVGGKLDYSGGVKMWEDIQFGTKDEAKQSMKIMLAYNKRDVVLTEEIYLKLRKYLGNVIHAGVFAGEDKCSCPNCASTSTSLYGTQITPAGTIGRTMVCDKCKVKFKVSNTTYLKSLEND